MSTLTPLARSSSAPRIALIHATALAVDPVNDAFIRLWPAAQRMNLLDDSLSVDHAANQGKLNAAMTQRFVDLAEYAKRTGADAILFTCSAFGSAIEIAKAAVGIPTLKPNEAMFEQALSLTAGGTDKIALIATFEPSLTSMSDEFKDMASQQGRRQAMSQHYVAEAMAALGAGDAAKHHRLIAEAAAALGEQELILLAQFSMAAAATETQARTTARVLTSPDCAVSALKKIFLSSSFSSSS